MKDRNDDDSNNERKWNRRINEMKERKKDWNERKKGLE